MSELLSAEEENQFSSSNLHSVASLDNLKQNTSVNSSVTKDTPTSEGLGKTPASKEGNILELQTPGSENFIRSNFQRALDEQSPDSPEQQSSAVETDEERRLREERESEALAWELMQQESMELYQLQMQFIRENAASLSHDDYQAMQMLINETGPQQQTARRTGGGRRRNRVEPTESNEESEGADVEGAETESYVSDEGEGDEYDEESEEQEEEEDDPENWDYERLLELGQVIGDVKTERWRKRAQDVIRSLPTVQYKEITALYEAGTTATSGSVEKKLKRPIEDISASPVKPTAVTTTEEIKKSSVSSSNSSSKDSLASLNTSHTESSASKTAVALCRTASSHKKKRNSCLPSKNRALDHRCAVCMDPFEAEDTLNLLPCQHYFHIPCTEGWMADHNSCPSCKAKISATPEK